MFDFWKLQDFVPGEGIAHKVFAEQFDTSDWIDISSPGDVHQALVEAGRIEDPFYDRNEDTCAWTVWEESCPVRLEANSSQVVWRSDAGKITAGPDRYLSVHSTNGCFPANRYFFSPIKELQRVPAQVEIAITPHGEHELHVHLRAVTYSYFLHLIVPDERTHFTDNYFDLEAGEKRTVILTNRSIALTPEMVSIVWR